MMELSMRYGAAFIFHGALMSVVSHRRRNRISEDIWLILHVQYLQNAGINLKHDKLNSNRLVSDALGGFLCSTCLKGKFT